MAKGRRRRSLLERLLPADDGIRKEQGLPPTRWLLPSEVSLPPEFVAGLATVESFEDRNLEVFYSTLVALGLRARATRWRKACQIRGPARVTVGRALSAVSREPAAVDPLVPPEPRPLGKNKPAMAHDAEEGFRVLRQLRLLRLWGPRLLGHELSEADLLYFGSRLGEIHTRMFEVRLSEPHVVDALALPLRMSKIGKLRWEQRRMEWALWRAVDRTIVEEARKAGQPIPSKRARAQAIKKRISVTYLRREIAETIRKRL
jgi:hypothetical protein